MHPWKLSRFRTPVRAERSSACDAARRSLERQLAVARRTVARVREDNRCVQAQLHSRTRFLASLSHELRAPLNGIIGFADLLASDVLPPDSPRRQAFLDNIHRSGRHLLQLIEDVMTLSRVEAGMRSFQPEPLDAAQVVARVVDILHTRLMRRRLSVVTQVDAALASMTADPPALLQALTHLLDYAVTVAPEGSEIRVRVLPHPPRGFRIEVASAAGQAPHPTRDASDTALGVTIARRLVQAQGGVTGMTSTPGGGTVLFLVLDQACAPAPSRAAASSASDDALPARSP